MMKTKVFRLKGTHYFFLKETICTLCELRKGKGKWEHLKGSPASSLGAGRAPEREGICGVTRGAAAGRQA